MMFRKKNAMKVVVLLLAVTLLCAACSDASSKNLSESKGSEGKGGGGTSEKTMMIQDAENTATSWILEEAPAQTPSEGEDLTFMEVGQTEKGRQKAAFVRLPLPAGVLAEDVISADLYLKKAKGDEPAVKMGLMGKRWHCANANWKTFGASLTKAKTSSGSAIGDDWYKYEVTDAVKIWLSGKSDNAGLFFLGAEKGTSTSFYSSMGEHSENYPKMEVTYRTSEEKTPCDRFAFMVQKAGNCMSYALRDTDMILYDALIPDNKAFQKVYDEGGIDSALDDVKKACFSYIEKHKAMLKVESIRELKGFDDQIDSAREYRAVLRIGFRDLAGDGKIQLPEDFDYHFMVQMKDGTWAEKTPGTDARVLPGSNAKLDPARYPWDQSDLWGYEKSDAYYTSDAVFFAVTKTVDEFTAHLKQDGR
jgi:hypothetical protein